MALLRAMTAASDAAVSEPIMKIAQRTKTWLGLPWSINQPNTKGEIAAPISIPADRNPKIRPAEPGGIMERTSMSREGRMLPSMIPAKAKIRMTGIAPKSDQAMASMADAEAT